MKDIKVKKDELLNTLIKNREEHERIYKEAVEKYKKALVVYLKKMTSRAEAGKRINHHINLVIPTHNIKDYDRVIGMLKMSVETEISLTENEFSQYVLDDWSWKSTFASNTQAYHLAGGNIKALTIDSVDYSNVFSTEDINLQD